MGGDDGTVANRTRSRNRLRRHSQRIVYDPNILLPFLPEELIVEIILRLPVRSLLQFKCVSKTWKTLISNPQFAKRHLLCSTPHLQLASSVVGRVQSETLSYPLKPLLEIPSTYVKPVILRSNCHQRILGSCNGLLCLYDYRQSTFRLWNPSIKFESNLSPTIVCNLHHNDIIYRGFGYDQVNDRYKVLVVMQNQNNFRETLTMGYTFGENSWTTVQNFPYQCDWRSLPDFHRYFYSHRWLGIFVSGNLNWIVNNKDAVDSNSTNQEVIISFDVEKETYGEVLLPQHDGDNVRDAVLCVLTNCICVSFDQKTHWVVWMMKEYGVIESWTKLMIISQNSLISDIFTGPWSDALFISENGVLLLRPKHSQLVVYKLKNNDRLQNRSTILGKFAFDLHIYHESLISPQW